ncbi:Proline utilization trans-activator 2 [Seiridium cupressi]
MTRAYSLDLQRNVARSIQNPPLGEEGGVRVVPSAPSAAEGSKSASSVSGHEEGSVLEEASADHGMDDTLQNADDSHAALSEGSEPIYLGTSSNWSFCRRILQMTHEHVRNVPLPSNTLLFDGMAYDVGWRGPFDSIDTNQPARVLIILYVSSRPSSFTAGKCFICLMTTNFIAVSSNFIRNQIKDFWKDLYHAEIIGKRPSGIEFFLKVMEILPPAYILCYGMHTDMPVAQLGEGHLQRCRKIWWTTYLLHRQMTSLMGEPQSIQDGDILMDGNMGRNPYIEVLRKDDDEGRRKLPSAAVKA